MTQSQNMTLVLGGLLVAGLASVGLAVAAFMRQADNVAQLRTRLQALSNLIEQMDARLRANPPPNETPKLYVATTNYVKALAQLTAETRRASSVFEPLLISCIPLGIAALLVTIDLLT
jgi:uncharacterized protein YukE